MNLFASPTNSHLRTYEAIFWQPVLANLAWSDVRALFGQLGQVGREANGNLRLTRNGQTLVLHPAIARDVAETAEVMALRDFLERSEVTSGKPPETRSGPASS